jgi:hypothetical protein
MRAREGRRLHPAGVRKLRKGDDGVDASIAQAGAVGEAAGAAGAACDEEALFDAVREQAEPVIAWARCGEALAMEHGPLEARALADGLELVRLLAQANLDLRAVREQRRGDAVDADGRRRGTAGDGHERTRIMVSGPVRTSRMAYRRRGQENLYPQDAELSWGEDACSAGIVRRVAKATAICPFGQAAGQVSEACAVRIGKRQAGQIAVAAAQDFEAFYAARRPEPCDGKTGLLISADGSALMVRPQALRPATARAAAARARKAAEPGWPDDPGELRKSRKRPAELAAVAGIPPAPRAPGGIIAALFAGDRAASSPGPPHPGPKAAGRTVFASARKAVSEVIADAFAGADRRDPGHDRPWSAVVDGNNAQIAAITAQAEKHKVKVPVLIDFIHVVQYLSAPACRIPRGAGRCPVRAFKEML